MKRSGGEGIRDACMHDKIRVEGDTCFGILFHPCRSPETEREYDDDWLVLWTSSALHSTQTSGNPALNFKNSNVKYFTHLES